jgi:lipopolysaccharide transport system permease protein
MTTASHSTGHASDLPEHIIAPARGLAALRLGEIWEYRELLFFLVWRDIKIRYKQTAMGAAWAILQPVVTMVVFSIFFGRLAQLPSDGVPYPVFTFCALLPWQLFAFALTESSNSVVVNQRLITKVYFPRLIMPLAAVGVGLVDFLVSLIVLIVLFVYYGITPSVWIWTLPFWVLCTVVTALSVGLWLSALNVRYRDVRYTLPFLTQIWLLATPVAYSTTLVPEAWRAVYAINPMVGVVSGFRWAIVGQTASPWPMVAVSAAAVAVLFVTGLIYFRRMEQTFADVI